MKFEKGEVVNHILTNERVLILKQWDEEYLVRLLNYGEILVKEFELEPIENAEKKPGS